MDLVIECASYTGDFWWTQRIRIWRGLCEGERVVGGWVWDASQGTHLLDFCSHLLKQIRNKGSDQFTMAWIINQNLSLITTLNANRKKALLGKKACCASCSRVNCPRISGFFLTACCGHQGPTGMRTVSRWGVRGVNRKRVNLHVFILFPELTICYIF